MNDNSTARFKEAIDYLIQRLDDIDKMNLPQNKTTNEWKKAADAVHHMLYPIKETATHKRLSENTYHRYLTKVKNAVKDTGRKHHGLTSNLCRKGYLPWTIKKLNESNLQRFIPALEEAVKTDANVVVKEVNAVKSSIKLERKNGTVTEAQERTATEALNALFLNHQVLNYLSLPENKKENRTMDDEEQVLHKNSHTLRYNIPKVIEIATENLESPSYTAVTWALGVLTGRRAAEIVRWAIFQKISNNQVLFSGQLKKRAGVESTPYPIYTLVDADLIISAIKRLRAMPEVACFRNGMVQWNGEEHSAKKLTKVQLNESINQKTASVLNERAKNLMDDPCEVFKNTRAIYIRHCINLYLDAPENKSKSEIVFVKELLGHDNDKNIKYYTHIKLSNEPSSQWAKEPEPRPKQQVTNEPKEPAKRNWRASTPVKKLFAEIDEYPSDTVEVKGRGVRLDTIREFNERLRVWCAENPKLKITQSAIEKNKGNTLDSGTGTVNVRANRGTFQGWLAIIGENKLTEINQSRE